MFNLPSTINLVEYSGQKWRNIKFPESANDGDAAHMPTNSKKCSVAVPLSREFFAVYQEFPLIDSNLLYDCKICGKVLQPGAIREHCSNADHQNVRWSAESAHESSSVSYRSRKSSSKSGLSLSGVSLKTTSSSSGSGLSLALAQSSSTSATISSPSNASNARNKRSAAKSNKRSRKDEKTEKIVVVEAADVVHVKKMIKREPDETMHVDSSSSPHFASIPAKAATLPISISNNLIKEDVKPIATSILTHTTPRTTFIKIASASNVTPTQATTTVVSLGKKKEQMVPVKQEVVAKATVNKTAQESLDVDTASMVHMPVCDAMSPVAVVNIVPVQYLPQYLQLPTQPFVVTIPSTNSSVHMCAYPKPLTVSTRAIRKIGNTYLLQNQRLDHQRAEIKAITRSQTAYANTTLNHLPT